jgi:hypothetical protein
MDEEGGSEEKLKGRGKGGERGGEESVYSGGAIYTGVCYDAPSLSFWSKPCLV